MANIQDLFDISNIKEPEDFQNTVSALLNSVVDTVNGNLEFSNMITQTVTFVFREVNTPVTVQHNLDKTGVNYIVVSKSAACDVYRAVQNDTNNSICLLGTGLAAVTLILF